MIKSEFARNYRLKYGKEIPTLTLAKIMYEHNKEVFKDVEDARCILRYIEGKRGEKDRGKIKNTEFFVEKERPKNPYNLPKSDETEWLPYHLEEVSKIGILSDIHIPYHSISAITCAFDFLIQKNVDCIVLNGDLFDFYQASRFQKNPKKRSLAEELHIGGEFLDALKEAFPKVKIIFKEGNHDERYALYVQQQAPQLMDIPNLKLENILKLSERKIDHIKDKRIIKAGGLNIIHGHEFSNNIFSPVSVARSLYLKAKTSAIQGHNHQVSEHPEPDMNGKITTTWSCGCLCELNPAYMPINKWSHGVAVVEVDHDDFFVENRRIFKGKLL